MKSLFELKTSKNPELKGDITLVKAEVLAFLENSLDIVYPGNVRRVFKTEDELESFQKDNIRLLENILGNLGISKERVHSIIKSFDESLCSISKLICTDATTLVDGDPSATSLTEVLLTFPGLEAIATHRVAHFFYQNQINILPRALSEIAHSKTGIDIHPGAVIGERFFIDHGTGLVIGETAIIGKNVKLYQGVTLGALSVDKSLAQKKRHPTIEDDCVIYSHATILGGDTVIGKKSVIGGNVWVTKSIPADSVVYHKSEVRLNIAGKPNQSINKATNYDEELTYEI
jgi:serine O-acetyltransferase